MLMPSIFGEDLFDRGVCLPSDTKNTVEDMEKITKAYKLAEKSHESTRHHITVFIPIIKDVAKQIDHIGVILNRVEKAHHTHFRLA